MIYKCFAALCMATLVCVQVSAGVMNKQHDAKMKSAQLLRKSLTSGSFLSASGSTPLTIAGGTVPIGNFVPITFPNSIQQQGDAIEEKRNKFEFELEKGSYLVTFTGTFNQSSTRAFTGVFKEIAIQIGPKLAFFLFDFNEVGNPQSNFMSQIIHLNTKSKISIVARVENFTSRIESLTVLNRSVSIVRLHD